MDRTNEHDNEERADDDGRRNGLWNLAEDVEEEKKEAEEEEVDEEE